MQHSTILFSPLVNYQTHLSKSVILFFYSFILSFLEIVLFVCCLLTALEILEKISLEPQRACAEIDCMVTTEAKQKWQFCEVLIYCVISCKIVQAVIVVS